MLGSRAKKEYARATHSSRSDRASTTTSRNRRSNLGRTELGTPRSTPMERPEQRGGGTAPDRSGNCPREPGETARHSTPDRECSALCSTRIIERKTHSSAESSQISTFTFRPGQSGRTRPRSQRSRVAGITMNDVRPIVHIAAR